MSQSRPLNILLIKRGALGDILMTTPLIRQLRFNYPNAIINYCTASGMQSALVNNEYLDKVLTLPEVAFTSKGIITFICFILNNRKSYDYIFVLGKQWRINLICRLFSAIIVGFAREKFSKLLLDKFTEYNSVERYQGLYYLDLLNSSGLAKANYDDSGLDLPILDCDKLTVNELLKQHELSEFFVVVNSGGNNQFESGGVRMLSEKLIVSLLAKISEKHPVILIGGKFDVINYSNYIKQLAPGARVYNWANKLNLAASSYLIELAKHFYTTDCGAMHLGVARHKGKNMTAIFGPTNPKHILLNIANYNVIWRDQAIFDANYQLYGKFKSQGNVYFTNIILRDIV